MWAVYERLTEILQSAGELEALLDAALGLLVDTLGLETAWAWLFEPEGGEIYLASSYRLPDPLLKPVKMTGYPCRCLEALGAGRLDPKAVDRISCSRLREVDAVPAQGRHTSFPLSYGGRKLGLINLGWRALTREEELWVKLACAQISARVDRGRWVEEREIYARQSERQRLARDLHDTLAQSFTAIALQVEGAQMVLGRPEVAQERLERALAVARESLETTRRVVYDLRGEKPLSLALRSTARAFTSRTGIPVRSSLDPIRLEPSVEHELLHIVTEALTNIERHAAAHRVTLKLAQEAGGVRLTVEDDGRGLSGPEGLGLTGMRERALQIGAELHLESGERGTRVSLRL